MNSKLGEKKHGVNFVIVLLFAFQRRIWGFVNSKSVNVRKEFRGVVRAEMFGQLTSGLENAWNKLKGEGLTSSITYVH